MTTHTFLRACLGGLLLGLTVWLPAAAQDTRAEAIQAQQAAKATTLAPEEAGRAELWVIRVMNSPLLAGGDGVFPVFGSVFPGSGLAGGIGYRDRYAEGMSLTTIAAASINASYRLEANFLGPRFANRTLRPRFEAAYLDANDVAFYGLGPRSQDEGRAGYEFIPRRAKAHLVFTPLSWLELEGGFEWLSFETTGEDVVPPPDLLLSAPGFGTELRYQVSGGTVALDTRTSPGYSTRGTLLRATHELYDERTGQPFDYRQTELEGVQLVPLLNEQFVLAFRGLITTAHADGDDDVPLPLLPYIGGGNTVRGLQNRRFADRNRAVLTAEYRWLPSRMVDMAIFLDSGQVAEFREGLRLKDFETAYGIGIRIHGPTFTALRVEAAHSSRGFVMIFAAGPAF